MTPSQPDPPFFLAFKNGSLAASHTHLDLNAISVALGDTPIIRELGSRPYPEDYFGPKRNSYYEISTAGNNTVLIGGKGQTPRKEGKLLGPLSGQNYSEFIGVADDAYDVDTPHARRHVVFVDRRYWVLLDDIDTRTDQPIELRFHTYGTIVPGGAPNGPGGWTFTEDKATLDILSPREGGLVGHIEHPAGWIHPVSVLSLMASTPRSHHAALTVISPRRSSDSLPAAVSAAISASQIDLTVDRDHIVFSHDQDGWQIVSVLVGR